MTLVDSLPDGDTLFSEISDEEWQIADQEDYRADDSREFGFSFMTLDRVWKNGT